MSFAIGHFAVGAGVTALLLYLLFPRLSYNRSLILFGGVWGMIPDAGKVSPIYRSQLVALHDSAVANVFWGHRYLDVVDASDSPEVSALAVAFFLTVTVVVETHSLARVPAFVDGRVPILVDGLRQVPGNGSWAFFRRLTAFGSLAAGTVLVAVPVVGDPQYVGLLLVSGTILALVSFGLLLEDATLTAVAAELIPAPLRWASKLLVTLGASGLALALLLTVPEMTALTVSYGALAVVVLVLLLRLWTPGVVSVEQLLDEEVGSREGSSTRTTRSRRH